MIMTSLIRMRRPVVFLLLLALTEFVLRASLHAQEPRGGSLRLTNLDWKLEGNIVTVTYDLIGVPEKTYVVAVALLRENDSKFKLVPKSVSGNVGMGKFSGTGRVIVWDYRKDVPQGLPGDGYYFEVVVKEATGNGNVWLYYLLGGVAVAGGGAAYLLVNQQKVTSPPGSTELPMPPARPSQ